MIRKSAKLDESIPLSLGNEMKAALPAYRQERLLAKLAEVEKAAASRLP